MEKKNYRLVAKLMDRRPVMKKGKGDKLYPKDEEDCSCCASIREPSHSWPFTLYKHCHTLKHKTNLVEEKLQYSEPYKTAVNMTVEDALCHIDSEDELIKKVAQHLILKKRR